MKIKENLLRNLIKQILLEVKFDGDAEDRYRAAFMQSSAEERKKAEEEGKDFDLEEYRKQFDQNYDIREYTPDIYDVGIIYQRNDTWSNKRWIFYVLYKKDNSRIQKHPFKEGWIQMKQPQTDKKQKKVVNKIHGKNLAAVLKSIPCTPLVKQTLDELFDFKIGKFGKEFVDKLDEGKQFLIDLSDRVMTQLYDSEDENIIKELSLTNSYLQKLTAIIADYIMDPIDEEDLDEDDLFELWGSQVDTFKSYMYNPKEEFVEHWQLEEKAYLTSRGLEKGLFSLCASTTSKERIYEQLTIQKQKVFGDSAVSSRVFTREMSKQMHLLPEEEVKQQFREFSIPGIREAISMSKGEIDRVIKNHALNQIREIKEQILGVYEGEEIPFFKYEVYLPFVKLKTGQTIKVDKSFTVRINKIEIWNMLLGTKFDPEQRPNITEQELKDIIMDPNGKVAEYNQGRKDEKRLKHKVPELIRILGPERALCTMVNYCNRPYMTGRGLSKFRAKQLFLRQAKEAQKQKKKQGK